MRGARLHYEVRRLQIGTSPRRLASRQIQLGLRLDSTRREAQEWREGSSCGGAVDSTRHSLERQFARARHTSRRAARRSPRAPHTKSAAAERRAEERREATRSGAAGRPTQRPAGRAIARMAL